MPLRTHIAAGLLVLLAGGGSRAQETLVDVTVLTPRATVSVADALVEGGHLWVSSRGLPEVNGFELKPEGLCRGSICVPAAGGKREVGGEVYVDVTALAERLQQAVVADLERRIFSLSTVPALHEARLQAGEAPDFVLADRAGKPHRLSDYRGRKVLLLTWASW